MVAIEKLGLLKMDFLGLTTLTIIDDALKLIAQTRGEKIQLPEIPLDDQETYEKVFHNGLTSGVFQFESHGMRDVLRRYKPNSIEDLTAFNALYRPGPIQGGMIDDFIERKHGRQQDRIRTAGAERDPGRDPRRHRLPGTGNADRQPLAGYSLGEADLLRRAMGKKKAEEMAQQRERFVNGAAQRRFSSEEDREDFRSDGAVCRLRLQQIALRRLRPAGLSHGISEDALSGGVHGRAADLGHGQH